MSDERAGNEHTEPPFVARTIHRFSVLIILAWLAITVVMDIGVPPLEQVAKEHSVSLSPTDAPSFKAMTRMGEDFKESNSDSVAMIVLEGQQPLGDDAHRYYDRFDSSVDRRSEACAAHPEFLGGSTHGGRRAKRRR